MKLLDGLALWPEFGADSWRPWRSILAAVDGTPERCEDVDLLRRVTHRTTFPREPFREFWAVAGRRAGKSRIAAAIAVVRAACVHYSLSPGERGVFVLVTADREQAKSEKRYASALVDAVPELAKLRENETADEIAFTTGTSILVKTASFRALRNITVIGAVCGEVAFWRDDTSANPATEILAALRPAMLTVPNSLLVGISSPYSQSGELYKTWRRSFARDDDVRRLVIQTDTRTLNPLADEEEIAAAYAEDPEKAGAEYGGIFRSDLEAFLSRDAIDDVVDVGVRERAPVAGIRYRAFVDPSGGSADAMAIAIAHTEGDAEVLDAVRVRKPPFSPESVVDEYAALLKTYRVGDVTGDRYAGEWPRERFRRCGIQYRPAERTRSQIYLELLPAVNARRVRLLDVAQIANELAALERRTGRGRDSVDHPQGGHDDLANAVAGALTLNAAGPAIRIRRVTPRDAVEAARLRNADPLRAVREDRRRLERELGY